MKNYVCNVCGSEYDNIDGYLACVTKCVESTKKKEKAKKVDAYLKDIIETEKHLNEVMKKFKKEFPDEFYLNFGTQEDCNCDNGGNCKCKESENKTENKDNKANKESTKEKHRSMEFYYEKDGKNEPKMTAKVDGKEVDDKLFKSVMKGTDVKDLMNWLTFM